MSFLLIRFLRRYPGIQNALKAHDRRYNESVAFIRNPPAGVSIIEICPPDDFKPGKFCRNPRLLLEGYEQGRALAASAIARWTARSKPEK